MIKFIESKSPDFVRVSQILDACEKANQWANRGPVYDALRNAITEHAGLGQEIEVVPCANAGIALEAMARLLAARAGRMLRWVVSDFSFRNLGRGYFSNTIVVDCDARGLIDATAVKNLPEDAWDGLIMVNPFGQGSPSDFEAARALVQGKYLLLDNAAGFGTNIPDLPWQAVSLHHTKPYGVGEGGFAVVPTHHADAFYGLLNYGDLPDPPDSWLNNGKISDISCAYILDRLERAGAWRPAYFEQSARIDALAIAAGYKPLTPLNSEVPAMSRGYIAPQDVPLSRLSAARHIIFGKYYKPMTDKPVAAQLFRRLINIPTHPDMAQATDSVITDDLYALIS